MQTIITFDVGIINIGRCNFGIIISIRILSIIFKLKQKYIFCMGESL